MSNVQDVGHWTRADPCHRVRSPPMAPPIHASDTRFSSANVFFNFRQPAPTIQTNVINLLAYPLGKLMAYSLPIATWRLPRWLGGAELSLNPGPWNIKEHALVYMMANVASMAPYAINAVVVAEFDYGKPVDYWFCVVLVMATQLTGFGLAGLCRRVLVWPSSMVWPQNLVTCTVLNTLHAEEDEGRGGITRYRYFMYLVLGAFLFWFLPGAWLPSSLCARRLIGVLQGTSSRRCRSFRGYAGSARTIFP